VFDEYHVNAVFLSNFANFVERPPGTDVELLRHR
jgi:hypothetical protein